MVVLRMLPHSWFPDMGIRNTFYNPVLLLQFQSHVQKGFLQPSTIFVSKLNILYAIQQCASSITIATPTPRFRFVTSHIRSSSFFSYFSFGKDLQSFPFLP